MRGNPVRFIGVRSVGGAALAILLVTALGCGEARTRSETKVAPEQTPALDQGLLQELTAKVDYLAHEPVTILVGPPAGDCRDEAFRCGRELDLFPRAKNICYQGASCVNNVTWRLVGGPKARCAGDLFTIARKEGSGSLDCFPAGFQITDAESDVNSGQPDAECDPDSLDYPAWWEYSVTLSNPDCPDDVARVDPLVIINPGARLY